MLRRALGDHPDPFGFPSADLAVVLAALAGVPGTVVVTLITTGSERSLRARIAKDLDAWARLPEGRTRAALLRHVDREVAALTTASPQACAYLRRARWAGAVAAVLLLFGFANAQGDPGRGRSSYGLAVSLLAIGILVGASALFSSIVGLIHRTLHHRAGV